MNAQRLSILAASCFAAAILSTLPIANAQTPTAAASASVAAGSTATATVGNREITASASETSVQAVGDSARVQLDDHVITVEPERVLVDGGERAKIPASAKNVRLSLSGSHLNVTADGKEVLSETIAK